MGQLWPQKCDMKSHYNVSSRARAFTQPKGGYVSIKQFKKVALDDGERLFPGENVHPSIVGMAVNYIVNANEGAKLGLLTKKGAFEKSLMGAALAENAYKQEGAKEKAWDLLSGIRRLDEPSICNACKLVSYDGWVHHDAKNSPGPDDINPDAETVWNIRTMVRRNVDFWGKSGPITQIGFAFDREAYTQMVVSGGGDYLTADTMWDMKVSKYNPTSANILQLLMYWIMGKHSPNQKIYEGIEKIGFFNPRLNMAYLLPVDTIPEDTVKRIEHDVICYGREFDDWGQLLPDDILI